MTQIRLVHWDDNTINNLRSCKPIETQTSSDTVDVATRRVKTAIAGRGKLIREEIELRGEDGFATGRAIVLQDSTAYLVTE